MSGPSRDDEEVDKFSFCPNNDKGEGNAKEGRMQGKSQTLQRNTLAYQ